MTYAIISDIHGNYPALQAVLADAQAQGAEKYLFLGDYVNTIPFQNEVADTLRGLSNAVVVSGNHEGYLRDHKQNPYMDIKMQNQMIYWVYLQLTPQNAEYMTTLPESMCINEYGSDIFLSHQNFVFFRQTFEGKSPSQTDRFCHK